MIFFEGFWANLAHGILAVVFFSAAVGKIRHLRAFSEYLRSIFGSFARSAAVTVVILEAAIALALVGRSTASVGSAAGMAFLAAATMIVAARLRVDVTTACGCWGTARRDRYTDLGYAQLTRQAWYAARNGLLMLLIWITRSLSNADSVLLDTGIVATPLVIVLAGLAVSIRHERAKLAAREHPRRMAFAPDLAPLVALSWYAPR